MTGDLDTAAVRDMLFQHRVANFLTHEADLIDRWQLKDWEALFTDDARYFVPPTDSSEGVNADPGKVLFYICDDRIRLRERVIRLEKQGCHSEFPRSKIRHLVTNVRATREGDAIIATASFAVWRSKDDITDTYVGHYRYRLVDAGQSFRIAEKWCVLDLASLRPQARISILL